MNEIKVGDWTITEAGKKELNILHGCGGVNRQLVEKMGRECCEILGIDPQADSVARDIAEEIVMHGTPVEEVVAKLQRHLEGGR
jgi:hypothetical protein